MPPYINGLIFGLIFVFSLGPAFWALFQTSVQKGFTKAIFLAVGISLSDIGYVALALLGISSLLQREEIKFWVAIGGAIILVAYGLYSWYRTPRIYPENSDTRFESGNLKYTLKGMILNGFNPFAIIFWVGIISVMAVNYNYNTVEQIGFFAGVLTTIFTLDVTKAFLANRLRNIVTPKSIMIMNRSVGLILILFAVRIIFHLWEQKGVVSLPF